MSKHNPVSGYKCTCQLLRALSVWEGWVSTLYLFPSQKCEALGNVRHFHNREREAEVEWAPLHSEPRKCRKHIKLQQNQRGRLESRLCPSVILLQVKRLLLGWLPSHWRPSANQYSLLCLVIKGKSTHKCCQRRAAKHMGTQHLEVPNSMARCRQQWDPATALLSDLQ